MPKFSIIIPVYNVEQYLHDCLDSVLAQTYPEWETICVNDGSTDNSLAILNEYAARDNRIHVINKENGGAASSRNAALKIAKGEYIFYLDSDDWIVPDALERLNKHIDGQDMICFSGQKYIEQEQIYHTPDVLTHATYETGWEYYNANALKPRDFQFVCPVLSIYRLDYVKNNNLWFHEEFYHEDAMYAPIAYFYAKKITVVPDSLYIYRIRPNSKQMSFKPQLLTDDAAIANALARFFIVQNDIDKKTVFRYISQLYQVTLRCNVDIYKAYVRPTIDWHLYYRVSRTKIRHRFNFLKYRLKFLFV